MVPGECDRFNDGAGDAAHLISVLDEDLFGQIGDHQVVLGNQDLQHMQSSRRRDGRLFGRSAYGGRWRRSDQVQIRS